MKSKKLIALLFALSLVACDGTNGEETDNKNGEEITPTPASKIYDYGAFLGRSENNKKDLDKYEFISIEIDEFSKDTIKSLNDSGTKIFAYLNVGSLEAYRDYYNRFKDVTFADYENWEDERWIDVSNTEWQNYISTTIASHLKDMGAYGVYMDNIDVYSVCKEMGKNVSGVTSGLKNIINNVNNLGLKVMANGGSEFFDDMFDKKDNIVNSIYAYHQEEVFSLIDDYDKDIFIKQESEDKAYYQTIASQFKNIGKEVFFLEYTKDSFLITQIDTYCKQKGYHYYISKTVGLL